MSDLFDEKEDNELENTLKKSRKPKKYRQAKYSDLATDIYDEDIENKDISVFFEDEAEENDNKENTISGLFNDMDEVSIDEGDESVINFEDNQDSISNDELSFDNNLKFLYDKEGVQEENNKNRRKKEKNKKLKLWQKVLVVLISFGIVLASGLAFLLYGPYPNFREWLITTAMTTMNHQYLAKWFFSDETIEGVLKKNYVVESGDEVDISQVKFVDYSGLKVMYKNKYEKEILTKDKDNDLYKLININENGMRGYLVALYDPSKVKIATSTNMNSYGEMLTDMVKKNNAVIGMNASGFYDPNYNGNGGKPHGIVIKNGKLVSNLEKPNVGGGIIGFTNDNKLILGKMTASQALQKGVRDAVEFGPYLIVNGKPSFIKGNGGWGTAPRSAIGQRQDGIVLFLVMDGRDYSHGIDGVGMVELTEILMRYGAYNASNLDGGTSSGLVIDGKLINKPVNGSGQKKTRKIPDAWIVTK